MTNQRKSESFSVDSTFLLSIGALGLVASILLSVLVSEMWILAIVLAIFSSTSLLLSRIERIREDIIENKEEKV